jgi:hypothetical protein
MGEELGVEVGVEVAGCGSGERVNVVLRAAKSEMTTF